MNIVINLAVLRQLTKELTLVVLTKKNALLELKNNYKLKKITFKSFSAAIFGTVTPVYFYECKSCFLHFPCLARIPLYPRCDLGLNRY